MTKEIVYTEKYALILSDDEIKQGDYFKPNRYEICIKATEVHKNEFMGNGALNDCKLIIAHRPLSDAPMLEGVPLLPTLPTRPTHFECGMEQSLSEDPFKMYTYKIGTTSNSQGQEELIGKYLIK
jgi:hypothetical protein